MVIIYKTIATLLPTLKHNTYKIIMQNSGKCFQKSVQWMYIYIIFYRNETLYANGWHKPKKISVLLLSLNKIEQERKSQKKNENNPFFERLYHKLTSTTAFWLRLLPLCWRYQLEIRLRLRKFYNLARVKICKKNSKISATGGVSDAKPQVAMSVWCWSVV